MLVSVPVTVPADATANGNCWAPFLETMPTNVSVTGFVEGVVGVVVVVSLLHAAASGARRQRASTASSRRIGRDIRAPCGRVSLTIRHPRPPDGLPGARPDARGQLPGGMI